MGYSQNATDQKTRISPRNPVSSRPGEESPNGVNRGEVPVFLVAGGAISQEGSGRDGNIFLMRRGIRSPQDPELDP
jgi:hypothetical protein